jgi:hypothetical protein
MSEDGHDDTVVVQGDVGETMEVEEEAEKKQEEQQQEERGQGKELQADDELRQRVIARQEEKGKGELSAAAEEEENVSDSKLLASQQRKRTKKNAEKGSISKQKEQPNLYYLSKQLENHTKQLSRMGSIVEQLPKYLKNADTQSRIIKQINSSMNQLQRQIGQIQKSVQKKSKQK